MIENSNYFGLKFWLDLPLIKFYDWRHPFNDMIIIIDLKNKIYCNLLSTLYDIQFECKSISFFD